MILYCLKSYIFIYYHTTFYIHWFHCCRVSASNLTSPCGQFSATSKLPSVSPSSRMYSATRSTDTNFVSTSAAPILRIWQKHSSRHVSTLSVEKREKSDKFGPKENVLCLVKHTTSTLQRIRVAEKIPVASKWDVLRWGSCSPSSLAAAVRSTTRPDPYVRLAFALFETIPHKQRQTHNRERNPIALSVLVPIFQPLDFHRALATWRWCASSSLAQSGPSIFFWHPNWQWKGALTSLRICSWNSSSSYFYLRMILWNVCIYIVHYILMCFFKCCFFLRSPLSLSLSPHFSFASAPKARTVSRPCRVSLKWA